MSASQCLIAPDTYRFLNFSHFVVNEDNWLDDIVVNMYVPPPLYLTQRTAEVQAAVVFTHIWHVLVN